MVSLSVYVFCLGRMEMTSSGNQIFIIDNHLMNYTFNSCYVFFRTNTKRLFSDKRNMPIGGYPLFVKINVNEQRRPINLDVLHLLCRRHKQMSMASSTEEVFF